MSHMNLKLAKIPKLQILVSTIGIHGTTYAAASEFNPASTDV